MKLNRKAILATGALAASAITFSLAAPAFAAEAPTPATHAAVTVTVDKADHDATVTTKKGTFTVKWEAVNKGKRDLVTVRSSSGKLVAAREVNAKRLDKVVDAAAKHPAAARHFFFKHLKHHAKSAKAAK